jgi:hypothetical protein
MININEKIKNIGEYFKGMNVAEGFIYITVCFPDGWKISNRLEEKYDVKAIKTENETGYYFFTSMDVGFEKLFEAIEDTISFNQVALLKQQLFMEKIKELQIIFEDEPIEVLKTIDFKYKKRKKKAESNEKEVELCQQES